LDTSAFFLICVPVILLAMNLLLFMTKKVQSSKLQIIGFESRWPKSLGEAITKFLNENNDLELINI
jgi:hypothetical protein